MEDPETSAATTVQAVWTQPQSGYMSLTEQAVLRLLFAEEFGSVRPGAVAVSASQTYGRQVCVTLFRRLQALCNAMCCGHGPPWKTPCLLPRPCAAR